MKEKAEIMWQRNGEAKSHIKVKGDGKKILVGIKTIVTEVAKTFSKESGIPETVMKSAILEFIREGLHE